LTWGKHMSLNWVAQQIVKREPGGLNLNVPRYNPRPSGVMQEGSAKEILALLESNPERWFTFAQIMAVIPGRTCKSLDWGCIFLRSMGYVECSRNDGRNSKYLRYRFKRNETT